MSRRTLVFAVALLLPACTTSPARELLQTLNSELLASSSATKTLERWCGDRIVAVRMATPVKAPSTEQLQRLGVASAGELRYRHVELRCGARVFSEADNWYVPGRLTPGMNQQLETTDTPFGTVVRPLQPYRRTLRATVLWSRLRPGVPREVLEHRALLYTADHQPFAEVVERYRRDVVVTPATHPPRPKAPPSTPDAGSRASQ